MTENAIQRIARLKSHFIQYSIAEKKDKNDLLDEAYSFNQKSTNYPAGIIPKFARKIIEIIDKAKLYQKSSSSLDARKEDAKRAGYPDEINLPIGKSTVNLCTEYRDSKDKFISNNEILEELAKKCDRSTDIDENVKACRSVTEEVILQCNPDQLCIKICGEILYTIGECH